jgi:hypothetical protein
MNNQRSITAQKDQNNVSVNSLEEMESCELSEKELKITILKKLSEP